MSAEESTILSQRETIYELRRQLVATQRDNETLREDLADKVGSLKKRLIEKAQEHQAALFSLNRAREDNRWGVDQVRDKALEFRAALAKQAAKHNDELRTLQDEKKDLLNQVFELRDRLQVPSPSYSEQHARLLDLEETNATLVNHNKVLGKQIEMLYQRINDLKSDSPVSKEKYLATVHALEDRNNRVDALVAQVIKVPTDTAVWARERGELTDQLASLHRKIKKLTEDLEDSEGHVNTLLKAQRRRQNKLNQLSDLIAKPVSGFSDEL